MNNTINTLKRILEENQADFNKLQDKIDSLLEQKKILEEKIGHYQSLISLEGGEVNVQKSHDQAQLPMKRTRRRPPQTAMSVLRRLIKKNENNFTVAEIRDQFEESYPKMKYSRHSFHNIVSEGIADGRIQLVEQGKGKTPSLYRNVRQRKLSDI
ncbi:hypothetical protein ACFL6N_04190 [Thermodesulfobacteriota bacterium]